MLKESFHIPVLTEEITELLMHRKDGVFLDVTSGFGGHSEKILNCLEKGTLFATDQDPEAIHHLKSKFKNDSRIKIQQARFSDLKNIFSEMEFDGILADIGVSSFQLDKPERGFSFNLDGPLDMRMNPDKGQSAAQWLAVAEELEIRDVLRHYGEEKFATRIAKGIIAERELKPILTTHHFAEIIDKAMPVVEKGKHPATRSFQAVRIFINQELEQIELFLDGSVELLATGGRLAVISFHSLEDRIVKRFIRHQVQGDRLPASVPVKDEALNKRMKMIVKAAKADEKELQENIRARSAILRVAEKL